METAKPVRKSHTNTSDLLTWSESPPPATTPTAVRSRKPSDGITKVVFGGQVTDEEHQSLMRRKPSSGYKVKEMTGSGIFAENAGDATSDSASSNPRKMSVRMVQKATNGISQISFSTEESVAPKKPTSIPEVAKQRELSGNMKRESDLKVKKHVSNAKSRELSGHDIFSLPPENLPRSRAAAHSLELKQKKNIDQPAPRTVRTSVKVSNPAGGKSNILFSEETVVKTERRIHNQKFRELSGNNIFKKDTPPGSAEKPVSQAKLREMSGSNIFSDGGKVASKDYGGVRKPPGGQSTISLI
ncbi:hypothetical protein V2J09_016309 [Rumex salicifolius]